MTKLLEGRLPLAGLMVAVVATLVGATPPLNPLVIRADQQRTTVAEDCNVSLAAAPTPRVDVREIPLQEPDTPPAPPPSASLREALQNVQQAVARNDRTAFDVALARARALISDYPTGGERRGAEEVIAMYGDVERLWNAQYRSPFFARESQEFAIANRYPGWEAAVRRSILTDATGTRFYPAGESRDFIAGIAAERLRRSGLSAATPQPRARESASTRSEVPAGPRSTSASTPPSRRSTPSSPTVRPSSQTTSRQTPSRTTETSTKRSSTSAAKPAPAERQTSSDARSGSRSAPAPSRATTSSPSTAAREPSAATRQPAITPSTAAAPSTPSSGNAGAMTGPGATTPLPTDDPFETATDPISSALPTDPAAPDGSDATTAASELPAAADPSATDPATPSRGRSIILPLILILIGLGVLVVLFRMSS